MNTFRRQLLILLAKPEHLKDRSSLPEVFCKEGVIKYFAKFLRKHLCQSLFLKKLKLSPCNLIGKETVPLAFSFYFYKIFKGPLSGLRQFLKTENPLKLMKNDFYLILKALLLLKIFTFLSWLSGLAGQRLEKKAKVNFEIYDVTDWT